MILTLIPPPFSITARMVEIDGLVIFQTQVRHMAVFEGHSVRRLTLFAASNPSERSLATVRRLYGPYYSQAFIIKWKVRGSFNRDS